MQYKFTVFFCCGIIHRLEPFLKTEIQQTKIMKSIIFLLIIGLATCYPASSKFETELAKISEKLQTKIGKQLPSASGLNVETLVALVDFIPGDFTLNEIIILASQTAFIEILDMKPVPNWFNGIKLN
jgi:hypothetical protein